jgi:general secretion pathway protein C
MTDTSIHLLILFAGAALIGRTVNVFVGNSLAIPPEAISIETRRAEAASEDAIPIAAFLQRNLFKALRERDVEDRVSKTDRCEPSRIDAVLLATLVSSEPEASVAMFQAKHEVGGFRVGDLFEHAEIMAIDRRRVLVERAGRCETFSLQENEPRAAPRAPEVGDGIQQIGGDEYEIPRAEVDAILSDLSRVAPIVRIVPSFHDGRADGFKLFAIRTGSFVSRLGVQNGDIIQRINGLEITDARAGLEIYAKLRDAQSITVDLVRRGTKKSLTYNIR